MFPANETCSNKGFEEPTVLTGPDNLLHFFGHNHGKGGGFGCSNEGYAHFIKTGGSVGEGWKPVHGLVTGSVKNEPVPVPISGDGIYGGKVYDTWIDFNSNDGASKLLHLVFSNVTWQTVTPAYPSSSSSLPPSSGRSVRWWMGFGGQANNLALIDAHPKAFSGIYTYIGAGVETSGLFDCPHNASFLRKAFAPYWARGLTVTPALALTNASVTSGAAEKQVAQVAAFAKAINVSGLMLDFEPATSAIPWVEAYASYVAAFSKAMHAEGLKAEMCVSSWGILDGHFLPNNEGYGIYAKTGVDTMMSMAGTYYGNNITNDLVNVDLELKQNVSISQLAAGIGTRIEPKISASCPTVKPMGCKIAGGQCYNWTETRLTSFIASLEKRGVKHIDFWRADIDEEGVCTEPWYFAAAEKFLAGGK